MVRATLDDRKHQTRRVADWRLAPLFEASLKVNGHVALKMLDGDIECPYGEAGDRLWVKENFRLWDYAIDQMCVEYEADKSLNLNEDTDKIVTCSPTIVKPKNIHAKGRDGKKKLRPSIFMFRWASRLTLAVTCVQVQRLQDITEQEIIAEGVDLTPVAPDHIPEPKRLFRMLWDSINENRAGCAWSCNPWVWAITFKRL